ncbi:hypothetical protein GCM10010269_83120 [Streptomyces humidus]|uniref:Uncharacterized protein n=1 Tax=Streptomyces humidus TaxID=52259 RepID=A0A918LD27_9ACTN|nr:hypothetical protein [Streptomyces humidus]GGS32183.1 hypothetical protein GCM10010269_83120 [Streptomyces humidus]
MTCTNKVTSHPATDSTALNKVNGVTFEQAAAARQAASGNRCRREIPDFAAGIERHALARS